MRITLPGQDIPLDLPDGKGVDLIWYEKLSALIKTLDAFLLSGAYSEGLYTPVLSSAGGTIPTFTGIALTGRYFKVGRMVTVRIVAGNVAGGTPGAGAFQLSVSLPLPVAANAIAGRVFAGAFNNAGTEGVAFADGAASATTAKLYKLGSSSNQVTLDCADFSNVSRGLSLTFLYPTD
jgi:hypothetical protein